VLTASGKSIDDQPAAVPGDAGVDAAPKPDALVDAPPPADAAPVD
jgi:hypothetical protein